MGWGKAKAQTTSSKVLCRKQADLIPVVSLMLVTDHQEPLTLKLFSLDNQALKKAYA